MKIVEVTWVDAQSRDAWEDIKTVTNDLALVKSVGYLFYKDKKLVTLALNNDTTNETLSCVMHIPQGCIKKIRYLK
jgi:hypothetical protein